MASVYKSLRKASDHLTIAAARMAKTPNPARAESNLRRELESMGIAAPAATEHDEASE